MFLNSLTTGIVQRWNAFRRTMVPQSVATWFLAVACILVLLCGLLAISGPLRSLAVRSLLIVTQTLPPQDANGYTNVLLLGVGDAGHDGDNLTDAMLVASIDPASGSIVLLSIPRDLYVVQPENAVSSRINSLYWQYKNRAEREDKTLAETGSSLLAMRELAEELERRMGIEIQGVARIDFSGFEQVIDAVGGIDITVPDALVDFDFPLKEGKVGVLRIPAGPQHMSGAVALQYARSRHSTSDFDRSNRQQQVLQAFIAKVRGTNVLVNGPILHSLQSVLQSHFASTFSSRELFGLVSFAATTDQRRMIRMHLNYNTGGDTYDAEPGGFVAGVEDETLSGAILLPSSLIGDPGDWGQIRTVTAFLVRHRDAYLSHSRIIITPAGVSSVQARRLRNELVRYGFAVDEFTEDAFASKSEASDVSHISMDNSGDRDATVFLASILGLPAETVDHNPAKPRAIRITLAKGFRFTPFQTLYEALSEGSTAK